MAWLTSTAARAQSPPHRLGVFSLLGNSVRVVAREIQEVEFKDVGMDDIVFSTVQALYLARHPQAQVSQHRAPEQLSVDQQVQIGNATGQRGELPGWVVQAARDASLSHVLLANSHVGAMEFRTGRSQVVGNHRVTGIGFYVSADGRVTNGSTGAVSSGYLAPFVQLRMTLLETGSGRVIHSASFSEGFIVGPPENEAPDPWRYMTRLAKSQALQALLRSTVKRGIEAALLVQ